MKKVKELNGNNPFRSEQEEEFIFTGIKMKQLEDSSISLDQENNVQQIEAVNISRERQKQLEAEVIEHARGELRRLNGSVQYAAVHTRPDLASRVGRLQATVNKATVEDLMEANSMLYYARVHSR